MLLVGRTPAPYGLLVGHHRDPDEEELVLALFCDPHLVDVASTQGGNESGNSKLNDADGIIV